MNSNELKELVKKHFSLVEADAVSEETITEEFETSSVDWLLSSKLSGIGI